MTRPFVRLSFLALPLVLASFASAQSGFDVTSISVAPSSVWEINRPIEIEFNHVVDFATVNLNTVQVRSAGGIPAPGTYYSIEPKRIGFQPDCPRAEDFSDGGLLPGGAAYTLFLPGAGGGMPTVLSQSGRELVQSHQVDFITPVSTLPSVLFIDPVPGAPRPRIRTSPTDLDATFVRIGGDPANVVYFQPRSPADPALGADVPAGFAAPLNLYSTTETRVEVEIRLNQPIDGTPANVSPERVLLEYESAPGTWTPLPHDVELVENCTQSGSAVRVTPIGILPQGRIVRVVLASEFADIVGQTRATPLVVGSFVVTTAVDPGTTTPGDAGDEVLEEFLIGGGGPGSLEDPEALRRYPGAIWGADRLEASLAAFGGTGGPGGNFDWKIGNDLPLSATNQPLIVLDTTFSIIQNDQGTVQQTVINGIVDVRNLHVTASGTLKIVGPNPCRILVSGHAQIDGRITVEGNDNFGVATLNTTNIPEPGSAGQAGGGRGGTGNPFTTQSSPAGGPGFGAFGAAGGGGGGGESGFRATWPSDLNDANRRPGGGGGGMLGPDFLRPAGIVAGYTNPNSCPDQSVIGLDGEEGFDGAPLATGAQTNASPPQGGTRGPRPFFDGDPTNDFWGTMRTQGNTLIHGELLDPWAGAGGGGGGNAIVSNSFPTTPFSPVGDEKGAGGGGAGGSLTILALGAIDFGPRGRIHATGGTGGGGENSQSGGLTRIGGGSGGGSGGHVVLQSAERIDLSAVVTNTLAGMPPGGIDALGGQGGAGANELGGAHANGIQTPPQLDALPPNSYPNFTAPCGVVSGQAGYTVSNIIGNNNPIGVVVCAGGDGGPGLIQLHAPTLSDILGPTLGETIFGAIKPPPVGSTPGAGVPEYLTINNPLAWDQLVPAFGRKSEAVSKWIALGGASVDPASPTPDAVHFLFGGTAANGHVVTTGSGASATVADLPAIFAGTLAASPATPYVAADARTLVIDGTALPDDIYLRTPALLRRFALELTSGATTEFEVGSASYDAATHELRLTVSASGMPLAGYVPGDAVALRPRFFRVATNGVADALPASARIRIEFQATTQDAVGDPDLAATSPWSSDLTALDPNVPPNPDYRFLRFRVAFDLAADGSALSPFSPVPSLDFVRLPFRF